MNVKHLFVYFLVSVLAVAVTAQTADWKIIESQFSTDEIGVATYNVVNDFGAVADGETDNTAAFQQGLNKIGNEGGGTLYVPAGKYVIEGKLVVPLGVTLRGDWKKPVKGQAIEGTILMAYHGRGSSDYNESFITMEPTTQVSHLSIWYPEQKPNSIEEYPPAILMGRQGVWGNDYCNVRHVTLVNTYRGICSSRVNAGGCHNVHEAFGTPLYLGIEIDNLADVGRLEWIDFSPEYWAGSGLPGSPASGSNYKNWIYENGTAIMMRRNDWSFACFADIEGYSVGFSASPSMASLGGNLNGHNYGINLTNCKTAVYAEGIAESGIMFTRFNVVNCENGVVVADGAPGIIHVNNWNIDATKNAVLINETAGTKVVMHQTIVMQGKVDALGGVLMANNCDFNNEVPQINIDANSRALLTGNRFATTAEIIDNSLFGCIIDNSPVATPALPEFPELSVPVTKPARNVMYIATDAPFNAVADGITDNTAAIQNALNKAAADGGGLVFLPPGHYKVLGYLTVPAGVELRGATDIGTVPKKQGSILEVYADKGNPNGQPFMKLSERSGIRGLTFNYPEQDATLLPDMPEYPWCIQVTGSDVYLVNIGIRATMHGVDMFSYKCDNHYIDYLAGHVFKNGIKVGGGSEGGQIWNTQFNAIAYAYGAQSKFGEWPNSPADPSNNPLKDLAYAYSDDNCDFLIVGNCTGQILYNDFHIGSQRGVVFGDGNGGSPSGISLGMAVDGSKRALCYSSLGSGGFDMINSQIVSTGDLGEKTRYIETESGFTGKGRIFASNYWGSPNHGIFAEGGELEIVSANFRNAGREYFMDIKGISQLSFLNSYIGKNSLINEGAEPKVSMESCLVDAIDIDTINCALWKNNLPSTASFSPENVLDRSGWTAYSYNDNRNASSAIDGNTATRWSTLESQSPGQWFSVDVRTPRRFNKVILDTSESPNDSPAAYAVYISDDGINWGNPIKTGISGASVTIISFEPVYAQYVKVEQTGTKSGYWSIHEFYLYISPELVGDMDILDRTGWVAYSFNDNYNAQNALDDDITTRWSTVGPQESGQWFSVDMKSQVVFNRIILDASNSPNDWPAGYAVYVSADGTNWGYPVVTGQGYAAITTIDIPLVKTQYVKVEQTGTKGGYWSINEFYLGLYSDIPEPAGALDRTGWIASSFNENRNAQSALDGYSNTRWSTIGSQEPGQWFSVNMTKRVKFNKIILDSKQGPNDWPAGYAVYISNDGEEWGTPIKTGTTTRSYTEIYFDEVEAQYIKIEQTGTKSNYWSIYEFYLCNIPEPEYNADNTIDRTYWTPFAFNTNSPATNAIDGNLDTRWATIAVQTPGQWFAMDMGAPTKFTKIVLDSSTSPGDKPAGYAVYLSADGEEWGDAITTGRTFTPGITVITFEEVESRYVKVEQTGTTGGYWSIYEFYLYGQGATEPVSTEKIAERIESGQSPQPVSAYIADATLYIRGLSNNYPVVVNIYNLSGQRVFTASSVISDFDVSSLQKGIYIVEIIQDGDIYREKVIKNK